MKKSKKRMVAALGGAGVGVLGAMGAVLYRRMRSKNIASLETVPRMDIAKFMGKWYEVARSPVAYENNCYGTTFEYTLRPNGSIVMMNSCRKGSFDGPLDIVEGIATVSNARTNAKLHMRSYWPFSGEYWIIDLDKDYRHAAMSNSDKTALWVLSRTPDIADDIFEGIKRRLAAKGFDAGALKKTPQPAPAPAG